MDGIADACRALEVPVVGGNVSLYNEGPEGPILPTPVVGMVGELRDAARAGGIGWRQENDVVALVATESWEPALAGSELAKLRGEAPAGELPAADLEALRRLHAAIRDGVSSGALASAHDVADGGLAGALADCCIASGLGARVELSGGRGAESLLFGEGPGAFVVSGSEEGVRSLGPLAEIVGTVGGSTLRIRGDEIDLTVRVDALALVHDEALPNLLH